VVKAREALGPSGEVDDDDAGEGIAQLFDRLHGRMGQMSDELSPEIGVFRIWPGSWPAVDISDGATGAGEKSPTAAAWAFGYGD
jgi:hypothetical protein